MNAIFSLFNNLVDNINYLFSEVGKIENSLEANDTEIRKIIEQCYEVHKAFYYQMRDFSAEYSKADDRLNRVQQELLIAQSVGVLNTSISREIKDNILYLLKILDRNENIIEKTQSEILKCMKTAGSQEQNVNKNRPGLDTLKDLCITVKNGVYLPSTANAAKSWIVAEGVTSGLVSLLDPIPIICIVSLYTAISHYNKYSKRSDKKKSLSEALAKISVLLDKLMGDADAFNGLHEKAMRELNKYLRSIENMVRRSLEEGPLSHSVLVDGMLLKTEKIQKSFKDMATIAENNEEKLRRSLLRINPSSIING